MPFQPGHPRVGGRPKGSVSLQSKCKQMGIDVFEEMLRIALLEKDIDKKFSKLTVLSQYLYSKPKDELDVNVNVELARQAEEIAALPKEEQVILLEAEVKRLKGE